LPLTRKEKFRQEAANYDIEMKLHKALRALMFLQLCQKRGLPAKPTEKLNLSTGTSSNSELLKDYKKKLLDNTQSSQENSVSSRNSSISLH
jgi:major membrane immunogen (membrane-anchored lipoprotein)